MLSSSLDALLKLSKTTSPKKLFDNDCMTMNLTLGGGGLIFFPWTSLGMDQNLRIRRSINQIDITVEIEIYGKISKAHSK